jgi:hypothetical protein
MGPQALKAVLACDAGQQNAMLTEAEGRPETKTDLRRRRGKPLTPPLRVEPLDLVLAAERHMGWDEAVLHRIHHAPDGLDGHRGFRRHEEAELEADPVRATYFSDHAEMKAIIFVSL